MAAWAIKQMNDVMQNSRRASCTSLEPSLDALLVEHVATRQRCNLLLAHIFLTDGAIHILRGVFVCASEGE